MRKEVFLYSGLFLGMSFCTPRSQERKKGPEGTQQIQWDKDLQNKISENYFEKEKNQKCPCSCGQQTVTVTITDTQTQTHIQAD